MKVSSVAQKEPHPAHIGFVSDEPIYHEGGALGRTPPSSRVRRSGQALEHPVGAPVARPDRGERLSGTEADHTFLLRRLRARRAIRIAVEDVDSGSVAGLPCFEAVSDFAHWSLFPGPWRAPVLRARPSFARSKETVAGRDGEPVWENDVLGRDRVHRLRPQDTRGSSAGRDEGA